MAPDGTGVTSGSRVNAGAPASEDVPLTSAETSTGVRIPETAALIFALVGIGIAIYLTILHYAKILPVCSNGGPINCTAVTTSSYSTVGSTNIPITVPGMGWFVISGLLALIVLVAGFRGLVAPEWVTNLHMVWSVLGLLTVFYLVYVEAVKLHKFCEWCSGVHLLIILTFIVILYRWQRMMAARYA